MSNYGYRFGYQGSEKDNEFKGEGNSYTTEFRQLDPRLGRWLSVDPVIQPWQSSYCSMDNSPISKNDVLGNKANDWIKKSGTNQWVWDKNVNSQSEAIKKYGKGTEYASGKDGLTYSSSWGNVKLLENGNWKITSETALNSRAQDWIIVAKKEIGRKETEENSGPRINEYLKSAGVSSPNAWCAAYVHWSFKQVGIKGAGALGKNWLKWGVELEKPIYGSVAVFNTGHIGFYLGTNKNGTYSILHGNWGDKVVISTYINPEEIKSFRYPSNK